jgi:hypothetical protein
MRCDLDCRQRAATQHGKLCGVAAAAAIPQCSMSSGCSQRIANCSRARMRDHALLLNFA